MSHTDQWCMQNPFWFQPAAFDERCISVKKIRRSRIGVRFDWCLMRTRKSLRSSSCVLPYHKCSALLLQMSPHEGRLWFPAGPVLRDGFVWLSHVSIGKTGKPMFRTNFKGGWTAPTDGQIRLPVRFESPFRLRWGCILINKAALNKASKGAAVSIPSWGG